jgi:hypothetical protein
VHFGGTQEEETDSALALRFQDAALAGIGGSIQRYLQFILWLAEVALAPTYAREQ